jgi:hypothetical protein
MADTKAATKDKKSTLSIPADIAEKFGELVELIKASRSMDDSERQYWIDVLPIMSEDQIQNLRDILDNEKKQLAEAATAYSEGMQENVKNVAHEFDEQTYKEKKRTRKEAEKLHEQEEREHEAAVLKELEGL